MATETRLTQPPDDLQSSEEAVAHALCQLLQAPKTPDPENLRQLTAAGRFLDAGRELLTRENEFTVETRQGQLYIRGRKLVMRRHTAALLDTLLDHFENLELSGLRFGTGLNAVSPPEACRFAQCLRDAGPRPDSPAWIRAFLAGESIDWVHIMTGADAGSDVSRAEKTALAHQLYSSACNSVRETVRRIAAGHPAGMRRSLRAVQDIIDFVMRDQAVMLGLCTIHDPGDRLYIHSVNVGITSICLGHQIGLSRNDLVRLGMAALFHDLGKIDIAPGILEKPGPLDTDEAEAVRRHPLDSVRRILNLKAPSDLVDRIILPAFEHHRKYDLSGYPPGIRVRPVRLFGRIIAICDVYDALTAPRVYRPRPLSPDRAVGVLLDHAGTEFDPVLIKWFVHMMGVFPVGTLVRLDTGEMGLICEGGDPRNGQTPQVLLLHPVAGGRYTTGDIVDLGRRDASGQPLRIIRETGHPSEIGIQPAACFMEMASR